MNVERNWDGWWEWMRHWVNVFAVTHFDFADRLIGGDFCCCYVT